MPPRRPEINRDVSDMVDNNALHITAQQAATFGEPREVMKESEAKALREKAARSEYLEGLVVQLQEQGATGLAVRDDAIVVQGFQLTPTGLIPPDTPDRESWKQVGALLHRLEGSIQWLIGDWIVYGEDVQWGDATAIAEQLGYEPSTIHSYASVCRSVNSLIRIKELSFAHHRLVMKFNPDQQVEALNYALREGLSVAAFRKVIQGTQEAPTLLPGEHLAIKPVSDQFKRLLKRDRKEAEEYLVQIATWAASQLSELRGGKK